MNSPHPVTVRIDPRLRQSLKALAAMRGVTLTDLLDEALTDWLNGKALLTESPGAAPTSPSEPR